MSALTEANHATGAAAGARAIQRLVELENHDRHVLTVFLTVDSSTPAGQKFTAQLHNVIRPIKHRLEGDSAQLAQLEEEIDRAAALIEKTRSSARGMAIYLCAVQNLALALPLPFHIEPRAYWDRRAWLGPLRELANPLNWMLVLVADKEIARIFVAGFDSIEELASLRDYVPGKHEQGAEAQSNFARNHDEWVRRHARHVVTELRQAEHIGEVGGLAVAAPSEMLAALKLQIPARFSDLPAAFFHVDAEAPAAQILERVKPLIAARRQKYDEALIETIVEAMGQRRTVGNLTEIASAVVASQVALLVAGPEAAPRGATCTGCELILPLTHEEECPVCGGRVTEQPDFLDYLADRVIRQGGTFERVQAEAAVPLAAGGGMAALLRYPLPVNGQSV